MKKFVFIVGWLILSTAFGSAEPLRVLVFGDSLASGYGLPKEEGFVPQLEKALDDLGQDSEVINAGVAGDTTLGALSRADFTFENEHDVVLLEIGANDMLRGVPPYLVKQNIEALIQKSEKPVYLVGIRAIPNYGILYSKAFDAIYHDLAQSYETGFYPFIFEKVFEEGILASNQYFQADRLHLNSKGVDIVTRDVAREFSVWLESLNQDAFLNN